MHKRCTEQTAPGDEGTKDTSRSAGERTCGGQEDKEVGATRKRSRGREMGRDSWKGKKRVSSQKMGSKTRELGTWSSVLTQRLLRVTAGRRIPREDWDCLEQGHS